MCPLYNSELACLQLPLPEAHVSGGGPLCTGAASHTSVKPGLQAALECSIGSAFGNRDPTPCWERNALPCGDIGDSLCVVTLSAY